VSAETFALLGREMLRGGCLPPLSMVSRAAVTNAIAVETQRLLLLRVLRGRIGQP